MALWLASYPDGASRRQRAGCRQRLALQPAQFLRERLGRGGGPTPSLTFLLCFFVFVFLMFCFFAAFFSMFFLVLCDV